MPRLKFAIFGAGFWSRYQLAGWREAGEVECVAIYNRTLSKAEELAHEFGVPAAYGDAEQLFARIPGLDFADVITDVETHARFVGLAAARRVPVICQKPMAPTLAACEEMVAAYRARELPFYVHENWRWQTPIRQLKKELSDGKIGSPFRARVMFCSSFPVFDNQPFLRELDKFILTDIGSHLFDAIRFLFGEARTLYCQTRRVHPEIKGEDVATVMFGMEGGATVTCEMSYASRTEHERFPETYFFVEGPQGSIELGPDYWLRVTTAEGTHARRYPPPRYAWADPAYDVVHASIVDCHRNLLRGLAGDPAAENSGADNLRTMRLVFGAYDSAQTGKVVSLA